MAKIERQFNIHSMLINKEFLKKIFDILNGMNLKGVSTKTEIIVKSEQEKSVYESLDDFINSKILPQRIESISIKVTPHKNEKGIQFFLNMAEKNPYYQLIGYDDGKLSAYQKQLTNLFDEYKNWYNFLFKFSSDRFVLPFIISLSFTALVWPLLLFLPMGIANQGIYGLAIFCIFVHYFSKLYDFLFPFFDIQIIRINRYEWLRKFIGAVSFAMVTNLVWKIIEQVAFKK